MRSCGLRYGLRAVCLLCIGVLVGVILMLTYTTVRQRAHVAYRSFISGRALDYRLPNTIIIGARKCGTGALITFLSHHPSIVAATAEVHFFDRAHNYARGLDWYRGRMPLSTSDQITVEKSPSYLVTKGVPIRIHRMNDTIRLILIVRDPVERMISEHAHRSANRLSKGLLQPKIDDFLIDEHGEVRTGDVLNIGIYAKHLKRFLKFFPLSQIHIVDGDDFVQRPLRELRKLERFLHVPKYFTKRHFVFNSTKGFYCINNNSAEVACLDKSKGHEHAIPSPYTLAKLRTFYKPYNNWFYKLAKHRFAWDNFRTS